MRLFLLFILLFTVRVSFSQNHVLFDSSNVSVRSFDIIELQELKQDKDFQYDELTGPPPNVWVRFWKWVWLKITEIMSTKSGQRTVYTTFTIIAVAAIVFFVLRVMGMNKSSLLSRNEGNLQFTTSIEDINSISFEDAIRDAVERRNFRLAIRLLYLQTLKQLADKEYIEWQIDKTNTDYIKEVAGKPWQSLFKKLSYNFEYAWYGDMNIGKEEFDSLNLQFQQFNTRL